MGINLAPKGRPTQDEREAGRMRAHQSYTALVEQLKLVNGNVLSELNSEHVSRYFAKDWEEYALVLDRLLDYESQRRYVEMGFLPPVSEPTPLYYFHKDVHELLLDILRGIIAARELQSLYPEKAPVLNLAKRLWSVAAEPE